MQAAAKRLLQSGYTIEALSSIGCADLATVVSSVFRRKEWTALKAAAGKSEPACREDDPTSLGLQMVSTTDGKLSRLECFGSAKMLQRLGEKRSAIEFGMQLTEDRDGDVNAQITASDDVKEALGALSSGMHGMAQRLMDAIGKEMRVEWQGGRGMAGDWEHEVLANFFTPHRASMYPHTDKSLVSMVMSPALWEGEKKGEWRGLRVKRDTGDYVDVEVEMQVLGEPSVLLLSGEWMKEFAGNAPSAAPVVHDVAASGRHPQRVSLAYFFYSRKAQQ